MSPRVKMPKSAKHRLDPVRGGWLDRPARAKLETVKPSISLLAVVLAAACCSKSSLPPAEPNPAAGCVTGGCSGTLCSDEGAPPAITTCEWRDEYVCYRDATCGRQADGACGWTQTESLTACLAAPPPPS